MVSFKKVQEMLCLCLIEEIIDEEEFVLLHEAYRPIVSSFFFAWRMKSCIELAVRGVRLYVKTSFGVSIQIVNMYRRIA